MDTLGYAYIMSHPTLVINLFIHYSRNDSNNQCDIMKSSLSTLSQLASFLLPHHFHIVETGFMPCHYRHVA